MSEGGVHDSTTWIQLVSVNAGVSIGARVTKLPFGFFSTESFKSDRVYGARFISQSEDSPKMSSCKRCGDIESTRLYRHMEDTLVVFMIRSMDGANSELFHVGWYSGRLHRMCSPHDHV
jgi:hypothetical protein